MASKQTHRQRVLRQARASLRKGWKIVPVPAGRKGPRLKAWPQLRLTDENFEGAFAPSDNIGVLLGEPSGGLADVDLDCRQAITVAGYFLPPTERLHGRRSKLHSHFWYLVHPAPPPAKFSDLDGTTLVELRSTGQLTVIPPSIHPEGERFRWEKTGKPARIEPAVLLGAVARVAASAMIARHWPKKGSRHEASMALAGFLLREGWAPDKVERFVMATARASGRDEEWAARKHDVRTTVRRLAKRKPTTGIPRLAELVDEQVVAKVRDWLGFRPHLEVHDTASLLPSVPQWPDAPDDKAFIGLPGRIVHLIEPESEADPVALLLQALISFGNAIGRTAHYRVGADRHFANLFTVLVGATSKARKGVSWSAIRDLFARADPTWADQCVQSGLSTGEGLVWAVRDPIEQGKVLDEGVEEKRLLAIEQEFAQPLKLMARENNILSTILRQAWDTGTLRTITKTKPAQATGAHISVVGHITKEELRRYLTETEQGNGFGNRILWSCVRRSKFLPDGGQLNEVAVIKLAEQLKKALDFARKVGLVKRDNEAREMWHEIYRDLSEGRLGLLGALTNRAEAQVTRLSMVYALMGRSAVVRREHLEAALALWNYVEASARFIFGGSLGDPIADEIWRALRNSPQGMTRTEISQVFQGHRRHSQLDRALSVLVESGMVTCRREPTGGRPEQRWLALGAAAKEAKK